MMLLMLLGVAVSSMIKDGFRLFSISTLNVEPALWLSSTTVTGESCLSTWIRAVSGVSASRISLF